MPSFALAPHDTIRLVDGFLQELEYRAMVEIDYESDYYYSMDGKNAVQANSLETAQLLIYMLKLILSDTSKHQLFSSLVEDGHLHINYSHHVTYDMIVDDVISNIVDSTPEPRALHKTPRDMKLWTASTICNYFR